MKAHHSLIMDISLLLYGLNQNLMGNLIPLIQLEYVLIINSENVRKES
jgi:hypothetical protein